MYKEEKIQERIRKQIQGLNCGRYSLTQAEWIALANMGNHPVDISGTAFLYGFLKGQRYAKKQMEIT